MHTAGGDTPGYQLCPGGQTVEEVKALSRVVRDTVSMITRSWRRPLCGYAKKTCHLSERKRTERPKMPHIRALQLSLPALTLAHLVRWTDHSHFSWPHVGVARNGKARLPCLLYPRSGRVDVHPSLSSATCLSSWTHAGQRHSAALLSGSFGGGLRLDVRATSRRGPTAKP